MADISNKTLAALVAATVLVVVVSTGVQLSKFNDVGLTGFATDSESGDVILDIASSLNIEVDGTYNDIDFGTCTPEAGNTFVASSNDTSTSSCDGDETGGEYIRINNIGNVNATVNVSSECTIANFLPQSGSSPNSTDFAVLSAGNGCAAGTVSWAPVDGPTADVSICTALTPGATNQLLVYARVNITADTLSPTGSCGINTLTFVGYVS